MPDTSPNQTVVVAPPPKDLTKNDTLESNQKSSTLQIRNTTNTTNVTEIIETRDIADATTTITLNANNATSLTTDLVCSPHTQSPESDPKSPTTPDTDIPHTSHGQTTIVMPACTNLIESEALAEVLPESDPKSDPKSPSVEMPDWRDQHTADTTDATTDAIPHMNETNHSRPHSPTDMDVSMSKPTHRKQNSISNVISSMLDTIRSENIEVSVRRDLSTWELQPHEVSVENSLATGTFGTVHLGSIVSNGFLKRNCVVKQVYRDDITREAMLDAIDRVVHMSHPHIVDLIAFTEVQGSFSLVMNQAAGCLFNVLHNGTASESVVPLSNKKVLDWSLQIMSGLRYLHQTANITLRNLNSKNILLFDNEEDGEDPYATEVNLNRHSTLKISDVCTTLMFDCGVPSSQHIAKAAWMAPEVLCCEIVGPSADVWSLGVVMWEMLSKEIPFHGCGVKEMFEDICSPDGLPLDVPKHRSDYWTKVLRPCWQRQADNRIKFADLLSLLNKHFAREEAKDLDNNVFVSPYPNDNIEVLPKAHDDYHRVERTKDSMFNQLSRYYDKWKAARSTKTQTKPMKHTTTTTSTPVITPDNFTSPSIDDDVDDGAQSLEQISEVFGTINNINSSHTITTHMIAPSVGDSHQHSIRRMSSGEYDYLLKVGRTTSKSK